MKHRSIFVILVVLSLTGPVAGFGFEPNLSGEITIGAVAAESADFAWTQLYAENRMELTSAVGDVWITAELFVETSPLEEEPYGIRPGEMYVDWGYESGRTTVGRQIITWGRMDALSILDMISPPDTERLFTGRGTPDPLPIFGATWNQDIPNGILDLVYIPLSPFPGGHVLGSNGSSPSDPTDFGLDEGEFGARVRWFLPLGDIGISGFHGRDRSPVIGNVPLEAKHHRLTVLGIDGAIPVGAAVVRFESGVFPERQFTPASPGNAAVQATQLQGAVGIDWMPENWRVVAEARGGILVQPDGTPADGTHLLDYGAELTRSFRQGEIEVFLQGMYQQHHDNVYLQAGMVWQPPAGPTIEFGAEYLYGSEGGFTFRDDGALPYLRIGLRY